MPSQEKKKKGKLKKFGEIAVEKGYVTEEDVAAALALQQELAGEGKQELIGIIMLQQGMITNEQLIDILRYYDDEKRP